MSQKGVFARGSMVDMSDLRWLGWGAVGVGAALAIRKLVQAQAGPVVGKEIPSSSLPPAHLPLGGADARADAPVSPLGADLGIIELKDLPAPEIVVLRPGGSATLRTPGTGSMFQGTAPGFGYITTIDWLAAGPGATNIVEKPLAGNEVLLRAIGWSVGLYNVGGPSRDKLERGVLRGGAPTDLRIRARTDWGPNDWVQIRRYIAQLAVVETYTGWEVEDTQVRLDWAPESTWIFGA